MKTTDDHEAIAHAVFSVKTLVSDNVTLFGYISLALFVGHRSFGLPDFGISAWHLLSIAVLGVTAIWITTRRVERRALVRLESQLRDAGATEKEIAEQLPTANRFIWSEGTRPQHPS